MIDHWRTLKKGLGSVRHAHRYMSGDLAAESFRKLTTERDVRLQREKNCVMDRQE